MRVSVRLKDPSTTFEEQGKILRFSETLVLERTDKVAKALKIGLLELVSNILETDEKETETPEKKQKTK